jgi:hypothetical protein
VTFSPRLSKSCADNISLFPWKIGTIVAAALVILHAEHERTTRSHTATNRYPERLTLHPHGKRHRLPDQHHQWSRPGVYTTTPDFRTWSYDTARGIAATS